MTTVDFQNDSDALFDEDTFEKSGHESRNYNDLSGGKAARIASALVVLGMAASAATPMTPGDETDPSAGAAAKQAPAEYVTPAHLRYPYLATGYVKPTVTPDENAKALMDDGIHPTAEGSRIMAEATLKAVFR